MRKIDRQESWWQPARGNFRFAVGAAIDERRRITATSLPRGVDLMPADGCKTVIGGRCKQSGMFWSKSGAENILALRCIHSSHRLDEFWKYRFNLSLALNDPLPLAA